MRRSVLLGLALATAMPGGGTWTQVLYAAGSNGELHTVDAATAATTLVGPTAPAGSIYGLGHDGSTPIALGYYGKLLQLAPATAAPSPKTAAATPRPR